MLKKVLLVAALLLVIAVLVVGAINRTNDKFTSTIGGRGAGFNAAAPSELPTSSQPAPGYGRGQGAQSQPYAAPAATSDLVAVEGTVVSIDNLAMKVMTANADQVLVQNRPWQYALELQFSAKVGDQIKMVGYDQSGYFVAAQLQNLTSGQTVELRDEIGRPGWSGRGRGSANKR